MKNRVFFFSNFPDCSEYKSFKNDFYPLLNRSIFTFTGPLFKGIARSKRSPALGSAQLCSRCQVSSPTISDPTLLHFNSSASSLPSSRHLAASPVSFLPVASFTSPRHGTLRVSPQSAQFCEAARLLANMRAAQTSTFS